MGFNYDVSSKAIGPYASLGVPEISWCGCAIVGMLPVIASAVFVVMENTVIVKALDSKSEGVPDLTDSAARYSSSRNRERLKNVVGRLHYFKEILAWTASVHDVP
jgi:hypothetical protein